MAAQEPTRLFNDDAGTRVVAGVDGAAEGLRAAAWAARLATQERDSIELVHAWIWPLMKVNLDPVPGVANSGLRHAAEQVLQEARDAAAATGTPAQLSTTLTTGHAGDVLVEASAGADLVVVGNRGLGGFYGRLLGSTGMRLAAHAHAPALIVRGDDRPDRPVVAGVDGSPESAAAVTTAAALAGRLSAPLRLVHISGHDAPAGQEGDRKAEQILADARESVAAGGLEVSTEHITARSVAQGLLEETGRAQVVVLGSHGKGRRFGSAVGSTANAALQHSGAPILIARPSK